MDDDVEVTRPRESVAVLAIRGSHDCSTEHELEALLDDAISSSKLVVVDVTDADFVDSSFLHNLVKAHRNAPARGSRFVLQLGTAPNVRRVLEISGLLEEMECASSREDALSRATA